MNDIEVQQAAHDYARAIIFKVNFQASDLPEEAFDIVMTHIHDQLVAAFIAGYAAGSIPKGAA